MGRFKYILTLVGMFGVETYLASFLIGSKQVAEPTMYISAERPTMTFVEPKYVRYVNITSRRQSRRNLLHYVNIEFEALVGFGNNVTLDIYCYEFLTNEYKRSFVEWHYRACTLLSKDRIIGAAIRRGGLTGPCPFPPGVYKLTNMSVLPEAIPRGFPFSRGRIYVNVTVTQTQAVIASGHIDMELKRMLRKNHNKNTKL